MPSFLDTYNPSILAIPAYHILTLLPHAYAITLGGGLKRWDNRNPHSTTMKAKLKERLSAEQFALYERLESCHRNGMENLPLFATAVVLGNLAGLKKDGMGGMTGFAASFLAVRAAYTAVYMGNTTQGLSMVRTGLWVTGVALCFQVFVKAAKALSGPAIAY